MKTFYELMFMITRPVNSDKKMEDKDRVKINRYSYWLMFRMKIIRNRFHLWVFLSKNPKMIQYRAKESDIGDLVASHYTMEESEVHINSGSTENDQVTTENNERIIEESKIFPSRTGKLILIDIIVSLQSSSISGDNKEKLPSAYHNGNINYSSEESNNTNSQ